MVALPTMEKDERLRLIVLRSRSRPDRMVCFFFLCLLSQRVGKDGSARHEDAAGDIELIGWVGNEDAVKHANMTIAGEYSAFGEFFAQDTESGCVSSR